MKDIKRLFKNRVAKKILLFFNENPHSIDTAKGISVWIDCQLDVVQQELNNLVKKGALVNHKTTYTSAYSYTNDRKIVRKIEAYIKKIKKIS